MAKKAAPKKSPPKKIKVPQLSTVRRPRADFDVANLKLQGKALSAKLSGAVIDGGIDCTIEGASTLTLTVMDWYGALLQSALLKGAVTLLFDGMSFTLVKISSSTDNKLGLTFEETAVNTLRQYKSAKKADRANTTRAQFIRSLILEPTDLRIAYRIPEVDEVQTIIGGGTSSASGPKPNEPGGNTGGWVTTGATWFPDCEGYKGDNLCDGGLYYAELGVAGGNAGMGGLLGPALGDKGELPYNQKLEVQFNGKTAVGLKQDIGSGQAGDRKYTIDLHRGLAERIGFISAGKAMVRVRKVA